MTFGRRLSRLRSRSRLSVRFSSARMYGKNGPAQTPTRSRLGLGSFPLVFDRPAAELGQLVACEIFAGFLVLAQVRIPERERSDCHRIGNELCIGCRLFAERAHRAAPLIRTV